jgi:predicted membrane channel-forming protein YqfA (hemolysin III family)
MGNMTSKIMNELHASVRQAMAGRNKRFGVALTFIAAAGPAFAQANTGGLCTLFSALKQIAGAAALIAIAIFVINSFFGKSSLIGEITTYVIIGCMVLVLAPSLVQAIGLSPACS